MLAIFLFFGEGGSKGEGRGPQKWAVCHAVGSMADHPCHSYVPSFFFSLGL